MKRHLLLFAFAIISTMLSSQSVPMAFEDWKTTDGTLNFYYKTATKTDSYGNIYVAGATLNSSGNTDILLAKYNSSGNQLWIQQYAGTGNSHDFAVAIAVTNTSVVLTGAVTNNTLIPETDAITLKYNSAGVLQWSAVYTGAGGSFDAGKDIVLDASGNSYVTGGTYNTSGNTDILLIKYNDSGTQQWAATYDYNSHLDDAGARVTVSGSNVTVVGPVTNTTGQYKVSTRAYSQSTGALITNGISLTATAYSITAVTDLITDASGNYYIVGSTSVSGQGENFYVRKFNSSLTSVWTYTYNAASNLDDIAKAVQVDASGNVYISGVTTHSTQGKNLTVIKLNSSGVNQWTQHSSFNGDDEAFDLALDASNNVYVTGYRASGINGDKNYYTTKYNTSGTKQWEIEGDGNSMNDMATNIVLDSLNNVIVTGQAETNPGNYAFATIRYVQKEVVPFTDLNSEPVNTNCLYLPNKGQLLNTNLTNETDIFFYNLSNTPESYMARNRLSFLQFHRDTIAATTDSIERIDMLFRNCNTNGKIYKNDNGTSYDYNFFVGDIKVTDIHAHNKIIAPEIYTGIDLHYSSNAYGVKAYFVLKPNADPKQISILLQGQQSATITSNKLNITGLLGSITLRKPNVYNISGGTNVPISGTGWAISGNTVSINTGAYNTSQPLVIEFSHTSANATAQLSSAGPSDNLNWCTYYGNAANDGFNRIATDKANNKYMAGTTDGNNYPVTSGVFSGGLSGGTYIVITKFDHLNRQFHSTYYGGSASSSSWGAINDLKGIAVDSLQNIFFVGRTNTSNFPFPATQPASSYHYTTNPANSGANYATSYVIKLDSAMETNLWGTHIGNTATAQLNDVMVDKNQNVTVVGWSLSSGTTFNFPTPPSGAYYNTQGQGLLFRFNNNGVAQYATRTANWIFRVVENQANGDYFIGTKLYTGDVGQKFKNPGGGAYFDDYVYLNDFYLARFNNQDSITWATVFGGTHEETLTDMAVKDSILILVGTSDGIGFPIKYAPGQYVDSVHTNFGATDLDLAFVRFNSYTGKHIYSSYYGGEELAVSLGIDRDDRGSACVIDDYGNYFISGTTTSDVASGFALQSANGFYYGSTYYGVSSGFLLSYNSNNDRRLATYFGGNSTHYSIGVGGDDTRMSDMAISNGALFIAGTTNANKFFPIYDASAGVAYMDTILNGPTATTLGMEGFVASFANASFVGVRNLDKNQVFSGVSVYPNPSQGLYTIEVDGLISNKIVNFNVYNTLGQIVYMDESKTQDGFISKQINLSNLTQGVYFINIIQNNKSLTVKVIKQ